jgi:hypothetical protein
MSWLYFLLAGFEVTTNGRFWVTAEVVDIKPEVQAELSRQAAAQGVEIGAYAAILLEEAAHIELPGKLSRKQICRTLQELGQFSHKIPLLPDEAFSRESLYRDHD